MLKNWPKRWLAAVSWTAALFLGGTAPTVHAAGERAMLKSCDDLFTHEYLK